MINLLAKSELREVNLYRQRVEEDRKQLSGTLTRSKVLAKEKLTHLSTLAVIFMSGCVTQSFFTQGHRTRSLAAYLATMHSVSSIARSN